MSILNSTHNLKQLNNQSFLTKPFQVMKTRIISLAIALIALFTFGNAFAQKANPKVNNPDKEDVLLSDIYSDGSYTICIDNARITGAGNSTSVSAFLEAVGTADVLCYNNGQNKKEDPSYMPGQTFKATGNTVNLGAPDSNGNIIITADDHVCVTISGSCKNAKGGFGWTSEVSNVDITKLTLYINGKPVDMTEYLNKGQIVHN